MPSSRSGARQAELGEEDARELVVVVLAGVDEHLLVARAQRRRDRRGLDELRPVADDREDLSPRLRELRLSIRRARTDAGRDSPASRSVAGTAVETAWSSIAATGWTSRVVEARNASSARGRSSSVHGALARAALTRSRRARVIEARMWSSSGGVSTAPSVDPEDRARRRLEHAAVRRDQQRLVEAALARDPRGEHVGRVGQRLDAVEHARRRVGDRPQPRPGRARSGSGSVSSSRRPPRVSTIRSSSWSGPAPACDSSRRASGADRLQIDRQPEVRGGPLEALEVLLERERPPVVDADHLEHAVAAQQALVGGRDRRRGGQRDLAVDRRQRAAEPWAQGWRAVAARARRTRAGSRPRPGGRSSPRRRPCPAARPTREPSGTRGRR